MIRTPNLRRNPRNQRGFTLIELLVVVVILGILSAVVVFALRGSNDKGRANASAIDERTLRTAEETFCARFGKYGSEKQLAGIEPAPDGQKHKFISEESTYNDIAISNTGGPCNGSGYMITSIPGVLPSTTTTTIPGSCDGAPSTWPKGKWCPAEAPPGPIGRTENGTFPVLNGPQMVQLSSGKVIAWIDGSRTSPVAIFDPASGNKGGWTSSAPLNLRNGSMVLIEGDQGTCGNNCGKVLAGGYVIDDSEDPDPNTTPGIHEGWYLFDPTQPGWNRVGAAQRTYDSTFTYQRMLQLKGSGCGADCGKVLITAKFNSNSARRPPTARLFDPKDNSFTVLPEQGFDSSQHGPVTSYLTDGRVLIVGEGMSCLLPPDNICSPAPKAMLYQPSNRTFVDTASPSSTWVGGVAVGLPSGRALVAGSEGVELYDSANGGSWQSVSGCPGDCHIVGTLPSQKVLAMARDSAQTALFDPVSGSWNAADDLDDVASAGAGLVLRSDIGPCGNHCGRALIAGDGKAELYTPSL